MSQELNNDLITWWTGQSFDGKELFALDEAGTLQLLPNNNIRERVIATLSPDSKDVVLKNLLEKFAQVESRVKEVELEWLASEDKMKMADKVTQLKEYLRTVSALGDFQKPALLLHDWEHTLYALAEENYNHKLKLAETAESLADSTDWKEVAQAFRDIADKWKLTGHIDKTRNDKLWNRIEAARKKFNDRKRSNQEEEGKDLLVNLDLKLDLVEQAEAIADSTEWKNTTETFHRLTDEWKTIGHTLNKKNEELWNRFLAAKSKFFERKRAHSSLVQTEQENNYAIKLTLLEKAEALKESTEWNATTLAMTSLMEEWKKTGRVPKEKGDELWNRFNAAQDQFFQAKKVHTDAIRVEQENNYALKSELLARAEQLKYSNYWSDATAEFNELFEEWKKIGPIARSHGNKMWEDFIGAKKFFFERKDANREQRKQYAVEQKVARVAQAKDLVVKLEAEIKEEHEKLADFKVAIENITPGKKAAELRSHLEKLITEGERQIKRLQDKFDQAKEDLKVPEEKAAVSVTEEPTADAVTSEATEG